MKMQMQIEISLDGGPLTEGFTLFTMAKKQQEMVDLLFPFLCKDQVVCFKLSSQSRVPVKLCEGRKIFIENILRQHYKPVRSPEEPKG